MDEENGAWLTYAEAGQRLGVSAESGIAAWNDSTPADILQRHEQSGSPPKLRG